MRARGTGFTLIELLGVAALLSLLTALGLSRVGLTLDAASLSGVASEVAAFDARVRLLARSQGALVVRFDAAAHAFVAKDLSSREVRSRQDVPERVSVAWRVIEDAPDSRAGSGTGALLIDRDGRSADFEVRLALGGRIEAVRIGGLTGLATRTHESGERAP